MGTIADHGALMRLSLPAGEKLSLRRGAFIASTHEMDFAAMRDAKGAKSWMRLFAGGSVSRIVWSCEADCEVTASLDFIGTTLSIPVGDGTPVSIAPKLFLGYLGTVSQALGRGAKKEFWVMSKLSGAGSVFLHVPGGYTVMEVDGSVVVDTDRVAATIGDLEAVGTMRGAKDILKSGEMDAVRMEGTGRIVLAHNSLGSVENEAAGWLSLIPGMDV